MEEVKRNTGSSASQRKKWGDVEISKYFLNKFFKAIPESPEEKVIKEATLLRILLCYFDKCCELLEKESENCETLKIMRKTFNMNKELKSRCSMQEATSATETLLLEYEVCAHDDLERQLANYSEMSKKEIKDDTEMAMEEVEPEKSAESEDASSLEKSTDEKNFPPRSKAECLEALIGMYFHLRMIQDDFKRKIRNLPKQDASNSTDNTATDDSKKDSLSEKDDSKTDPMVKLLLNRMEFIYNMKFLVRANLLLFKRMNPEWMEPEVEKVSEAVAKRETFETTKMVSTDSSASSDNPPSVASSSDNPSSVASCSDNPPSVASCSDNPSSVASSSENPPSSVSSGIEVNEPSSVSSDAHDQSSMDVDP